MTTAPTHPTRAKRAFRLTVVGLAAALAAVALAATGCSGAQSAAPSTSASTTSAAAGSATTAPSDTTQPSTSAQPAPSTTTGSATELKITDKVVGKGAAAKAGDTVTVDYTGWLTDGTKFDSSVGKQPFTFTLGAGQVIEGWDKGVAGMKVGGTRVLIIPASMGYGAQGAGGVIPPNATLKFEVTLHSIGGQ